MNFTASVWVLAVVHLAGVGLLFLALQRLAPSPFVPWLVAWYAGHVHLGSLFVWWTAGLHRLPHLALSALALLAYARFREAPTVRNGALTLCPGLLSLGFYEKAVLLPTVLLAVELALWHRTPSVTRRRAFVLHGVGMLLALAYYASTRALVESLWRRHSTDVEFLFTHARLSWLMLVRSAGGHAYESGWVGASLLAAMILVTVTRARSSALSWVLGLGAVTLQLVATGFSEVRSRGWGEILAVYSHRYYTEAFFVLVVFAALAAREARRGGRPGRRAPPSWSALARGGSARRAALPALVALAPPLLVGAHTLTSAHTWLRVTADLYKDGLIVKRYRDTVEREVRRLVRTGTPLVFVDGFVPRLVDPTQGPTARHSYMLEAMDYRARFASPGPGVLAITETGRIVPSTAPGTRRQ
jgi:hypothetical protein